MSHGFKFSDLLTSFKDKSIPNAVCGIVKIVKGEYDGKVLRCRRKTDIDEKVCKDAADMSAGLLTTLLEVNNDNLIHFFEKGGSRKYAKVYVVHGREVGMLANQGLSEFFANLKALFSDVLNASDSDKLVFYCEKGKDYDSKLEELRDKGYSDVADFFEKVMNDAVDLPINTPKSDINAVKDAVLPDFPKNRIIAGAPGTGKSAHLNKQVLEEGSFDEDNVTRVTFHPEYSYYDFVGSFRPRMSKEVKGKIEYAFVPGPFAQVLKKALANKTTPYCLIIEEINRARVAAVFGDVFQLLDRKGGKDGKAGESQYSIIPSQELAEFLAEGGETGVSVGENGPSPLFLPANMYIWATMNSADQGVFPMDTAFKRRWSFEYQPLDPGEEIKDQWDRIRRKINGILLGKHVNEDKLMGYYFLNEAERADLDSSLRDKVLMYLFDDAAKPYRTEIFSGDLLYSKLKARVNLNDAKLGIFQEVVNPETESPAVPEGNAGEAPAQEGDDSPTVK